MLPSKSLESTGLSVQEKKRKIDFQDGGHLGFPIGTILAIFDLQATLMVPSKFFQQKISAYLHITRCKF